MAEARRVTVYEATDGWRFRVQANNWHIIDASEQGRKGRTGKWRTLRKVTKRYPGVELVVIEP